MLEASVDDQEHLQLQAHFFRFQFRPLTTPRVEVPLPLPMSLGKMGHPLLIM